MITGQPYFMTNKEWYKYNQAKGMYELTDKATTQAKLSYQQFYKQQGKMFEGKGKEVE